MTIKANARSYGHLAAEKRRRMTGIEFVKGLVDGSVPLNTMARTLGYDVAEAQEGRVVVVLETRDVHLNPAGTVHGGLAATLLDSAMGLAIETALPKGAGSTTLEFKVSFIRPIPPDAGLLRAEGRILNCGRRVGTAEGHLRDKDGRLLAHGTTTCFIVAAD